jgi:hypothetical protein
VSPALARAGDLSVTDAHLYIAYVLPGGFVLLALWALGVVIFNRGPGEWFWRLLAALQVIVAIQVVVGIVLLLQGFRPTVWRHYIYGAVMPLLLLWIAHRLAAGKPVLGFGRDRFTEVPWAVFGVVGFILAAATFMAYITGTS